LLVFVKRTQFQYHLTVTRQKFFRGPQVETPWRKRSAKCFGLQENKSKQGRKYDAGFIMYRICKESRKTKSNDEKDDDNHKKQDSYNQQ